MSGKSIARMSQQSDVIQLNEPVGGRQALRPSRKYEILAKDFTSVEQGVPLRLPYGRVRCAGVQITPIFNFRNEAITTEAGGK